MKMTNVNKAMSAYGAAISRSQANVPTAAPPALAPRFESLVRAELQGTGEALRNSEAKAVEGLSGQASLQQVVEAVTEAELSLQKVTAVRDRVISAYQEIMRMPI
jgi:flagellar hook-basal body complex protein FliE